jgi:hypothetical protein
MPEKQDEKTEAATEKPEPKASRRAPEASPPAPVPPPVSYPPVGAVVRYVPPKGDRAVSAILVSVSPAGAADLKVTPRVMPRLGHLAAGVVRRVDVPYSKELRQGHWSA